MASLLDVSVWLTAATQRVGAALGCNVEVYREPVSRADRGYSVRLHGIAERDLPGLLDKLAKTSDERTSEPNGRFDHLDLG